MVNDNDYSNDCDNDYDNYHNETYIDVDKDCQYW